MQDNIIHPSMTISNIRTRYPLISSQINDIMDNIYIDIVRLIGYESTYDVVLTSGVFDELYNDMIDDIEDDFGTDPASITSVIELNSGGILDYDISLNVIKRKIKAVR